MRAFKTGVGVFVLLFTATGCGLNFYFGRPSDVRRIEQLSSELDQIRMQKDAEAQQLRDAQAMLEQKLQDEIGKNQVRLEMAERGLVISFVAEVLFDSGKAKLRLEADETLAKVASVILDKVADREIGVEGHTDNEPIKRSGWKSNWELSTARATSVLHSLEAHGIDPHRLVATGYGEYRPIDSNDTAAGRQKNRRVEIVILPKKLTQREKQILERAKTSSEPGVAEKARALEEYK